jgi:hypothetical protein
LARASGLPGAADPVRTTKQIIAFSLILLVALSTQAQGTFQNLNFEQANPVIDTGNPYYPFVTAASALPGWTVYLGDVQQTDVLQNVSTTGAAAVEIFGPTNRATATQPGSLDGQYSAFLEAGFGLPTVLLSASIAQSGMVPRRI